MLATKTRATILIASRLTPRAGRRSPACAMFFMLIYLLGVSGVPLPWYESVQPAGLSNDSFPCAKSSCGCRTAAQCWQNCCCHTLAQRIAWARQHGVTPPASALAAFQAETKRPSSARPRLACCQQRTHVAAIASNAIDASQPHQQTTASPKGSIVLTIRSLKCRGLTPFNTFVLTTTHTPVRVFLVEPRTFCLAWLGALPSELAVCRNDSPDVPPPRCTEHRV